MNPVRPPLPQAAPTRPVRSAADARAAFFQAVKGTAPTSAVQPRQPAPAATLPAKAPAPPAATGEPAAPQRYLRPGSIVDIKV